jgi:hypothetical protein
MTKPTEKAEKAEKADAPAGLEAVAPGAFVSCLDPIHQEQVIGRVLRLAEGGQAHVAWFTAAGSTEEICFAPAALAVVAAPGPAAEAPGAEPAEEHHPAKHWYGHGKGKK